METTQNTQIDATINRKILLLYRTDTAQHVSGIIMSIITNTNKPTTGENTSTSTFIRKTEAATAV
jgi:muramoyltetrapeptide carboxypeptidase LdcA involved in peptidoglycan recycling